MDFSIWFTFWILFMNDNLLAETCGNVSSIKGTVEEDATASFIFTPTANYNLKEINWYYETPDNKNNSLICIKENSCSSTKYRNCSDRNDGHHKYLCVHNVSKSDAGFYLVYCGEKVWSDRAKLEVIPRSTALNRDISVSKQPEQTSYPTTKQKPPPDTGHKLGNKMQNSEQNGTGSRPLTNNPLKDTEHVDEKAQNSKTSILYGSLISGGIGVIMAVLIGVMIIKARKRRQQGKTGLASGTGQNNINSNGDQGNLSHGNDLPSAAEASGNQATAIRDSTTTQIETKYLSVQQNSEKVSNLPQRTTGQNSETGVDKNAEYAAVVPKRLRQSGNVQCNENENSEAKEAQNAEYACVVSKQLQNGSKGSQQTSDEKKELQLTYADLDLASRPQSVPCTRQQEVTEYVSIDIVKTATLKQKQTL